MSEQRVPIRAEADIIEARRVGRSAAARIGFGSADQTRLATAISELTRNVLQHAGEGECTIRDISTGESIGIRVIVVDHGPGIANVEQALQYGYSTGDGLGAGLAATKNLVDKLEIESRPGETKVTIEMKRRRQ